MRKILELHGEIVTWYNYRMIDDDEKKGGNIF